MFKCPLTEEQKQFFSVKWLEEKELNIRIRRIEKHLGFAHTPLNTEEQQELKDFEVKMLKAISFSMYLEDKDL